MNNKFHVCVRRFRWVFTGGEGRRGSVGGMLCLHSEVENNHKYKATSRPSNTVSRTCVLL